jgi:hypothetical protein
MIVQDPILHGNRCALLIAAAAVTACLADFTGGWSPSSSASSNQPSSISDRGSLGRVPAS